MARLQERVSRNLNEVRPSTKQKQGGTLPMRKTRKEYFKLLFEAAMNHHHGVYTHDRNFEPASQKEIAHSMGEGWSQHRLSRWVNNCFGEGWWKRYRLLLRKGQIFSFNDLVNTAASTFENDEDFGFDDMGED
jgi:hypothetical protein